MLRDAEVKTTDSESRPVWDRRFITRLSLVINQGFSYVCTVLFSMVLTCTICFLFHSSFPCLCSLEVLISPVGSVREKELLAPASQWWHPGSGGYV